MQNTTGLPLIDFSAFSIFFVADENGTCFTLAATVSACNDAGEAPPGDPAEIVVP